MNLSCIYVSLNNDALAGTSSGRSFIDKVRRFFSPRLRAEQDGFSFLGTVHSGDSLVVNANSEIRVVVRSNTVGLEAVAFTVDFRPLDVSGNIVPSAGSLRPQSFSAFVGLQPAVFPVIPITSTFSVDPGFTSPGGFRFDVNIPPQAPTHDASLGAFIDVFGK